MKNKLLIIIFLLSSIIAFSQSVTKENNITMTRGDSVICTLRVIGDKSTHSMSFAVKEGTALSYPRIIQKDLFDGISLSYSSPYTYIYVTIKPEDTQDLTPKYYYYDVYDSTTKTTIINALLTIKADVQTPFDGTNLPEDGVRITTVSLANGSIENEVCLWDTVLKVWMPSGVTFSQSGSVNNADSLGGVPALSYLLKVDSILYLTPADANVLFNQKVNLLDAGTNRLTTITKDTSQFKIEAAYVPIFGPTQFSAFTQTFNNFTFSAGSIDINGLLFNNGNSINNPDSLNDLPGSSYMLKEDSLNFANSDHNHSGIYEPVKDANDNYVTDAQLVIIGNTSGTNTGDNATNSQYSGLATSKQDAMGPDDNYVTDAEKIVIGNTSGTNTGDNATNSQYSGLATSKLNVSDAQLFVDSVYRSNDTIYFKQKDGSRLFFVDQNSGGVGDTSIFTLRDIDSLLSILASNDALWSGKQDAITTGSIGATQIASTTVTAGSYTNTNLTVDADGRITAASNGTGGSGSSPGDGINSNLVSTLLAQGYYVSKVEMFSSNTAPMVINPQDSGDVLVIMVYGNIVSSWSGETFDLYYGGVSQFSITLNNDFITPFHITDTILVDDTSNIDFGLYVGSLDAWAENQSATVITLKKNLYAGMTNDERIINDMTWTYLDLDTTGVDPEFPDSLDAAVSTVIASQIRAVGSNDVGRVNMLTSGEYRTNSNNTWSAWYSTERYIKDIDSIQVRDTSSATNSQTTLTIVRVAGVVDTFSVTTTSSGGGGGSTVYTSGVDYKWNHLTLTNNTEFYEWFDSTANNLRLYGSNADQIYMPTNVDSGVVWRAYDNYLRQVSSFPAGLFDGALTIEMVVKVIRTDSSQCFFQARNSSNVAMGIGIGATGIFVGNAYDATNAEDYTHNSAATTGWHHLVYVWNGTTTTAFYVDGELVTDTGDLNQYDMISGDNRMSMGKTSATNFPICTGTIIPYIAIFKEALTPTEVANNYGSPNIQNHIPAWAR